MYRIYVLHKSFREVGNLRWLLAILGIYIVVKRRKGSGRGLLLVSLLTVYVFLFISFRPLPLVSRQLLPYFMSPPLLLNPSIEDVEARVTNEKARNVLRYLRIIHDLLEEGGIWINLGPLLWHFENSQQVSGRGEGSVELSLDEVKELARQVGFELSVSFVSRSVDLFES